MTSKLFEPAVSELREQLSDHKKFFSQAWIWVRSAAEMPTAGVLVSAREASGDEIMFTSAEGSKIVVTFINPMPFEQAKSALERHVGHLVDALGEWRDANATSSPSKNAPEDGERANVPQYRNMTGGAKRS